MSEKILAAVAVATKKTEILEFPTPEITPDAGILRVETVGVCGTDVSNYSHIKKSTILGHHVVGYIEKIGTVAAERWGVSVGDRVVMEEYIPCGHCERCLTGKFRTCLYTDSKLGGLRYGATPISTEPSLFGGFSQYMYLHPNCVVHRIQNKVAAVEASFTLPLSNGFEWMCNEGNVGIGKTVLIQGAGQQGLACALAAKAAGADCVIVTGRNSSTRRLELAKTIGADYAINVQAEDLKSRVQEITDGRMVDIVLDVTSGGTGPIQDAIELTKKQGTVLLAAYKYQKNPEFDFDTVIAKMLTIKGVRGHSYQSVEMAIQCVSSGRFPIYLLNSHDYNLYEVDNALKTAGGEGDPNPLLVTVSPWKS